MRRRFTRLAIASALLLCASTIYVLGGLHVYQAYQREYPDWTSATGPCGALITWSPPRILYTGLYVNQQSLLTLRYRSPQPQSLEISVSIPQFTQDQTKQVQATPVFQSLAFDPPILNGSVLDALIGPGKRTAELRLHIENSNSVVCDISSTIVLMSPEWMLWSDAAHNNNAPYLAGWVTPGAPEIHNLIGAANLWIAAHPTWYPGLIDLEGYNGRASADQVREEVDAIFDTLQFDYHLSYASDTVPYLENNAQLIQLPSVILSLKNPYGMCVETTAIMASAVESLGMRPYFIIVAQHAFLGVALGNSPGAPIAYWETSDLSGGANSDRSKGGQANLNGDDEYRQDQNNILYTVDVQYWQHHGISPIE